jgi:hypothetical protein
MLDNRLRRPYRIKGVNKPIQINQIKSNHAGYPSAYIPVYSPGVTEQKGSKQGFLSWLFVSKKFLIDTVYSPGVTEQKGSKQGFLNWLFVSKKFLIDTVPSFTILEIQGFGQIMAIVSWDSKL